MSEIDYPAVFEALAGYIEAQCDGSGSLPLVHGYDHMPDRPMNPAWFPGPVDIEANKSMRGLDAATIESYLTVDRTGDPRSAQRELAGLLRRDVATSVRYALNEARKTRIDGLVGGMNVQRITGWREYLFGEVRMYGARIDIMIIGA